ncbi:hypothetical protein ACVWY0_001082 [Arthrobacter sp. UYNi723]
MNENKFFPQNSGECQQMHGEVSAGQRKFVVSYWTGLEIFHAHIRPEPGHTGVVEDPELGQFLSQTILSYKILEADKPFQRGRFQQIETVPDEQRMGWASDMVRALLTFFPTTYWNNENLNEMSGPLFMKLQAEFPQRIAAITDKGDGTYRVAENPIPGA